MAHRTYGAPWLLILSTLVAIAGVSPWMHFSKVALKETQATLASLSMSDVLRISTEVVFIRSATSLTVMVLVFALLGSVYRSCALKNKQGGGGKQTCYLWTSGISGFFMWGLLLFMVALVGAFTLWLTAMVVVHGASKEGQQLADKSQQAVRDINTAIDDLVLKYERYQPMLPPAVSQDIGPDVQQLARLRANKTCPDTCVDLSVLGDAVSARYRCLCGDKLRPVVEHSAVAASKLAVAYLALWVALVGISWVLMCVVAQHSETKEGGRRGSYQPLPVQDRPPTYLEAMGR